MNESEENLEFEQLQDPVLNEIVSKPPHSGLAGIISYAKLINRTYNMVKDDKNTIFRHQAMLLLLCNRNILCNKLENRLLNLKQKHQSLQKPLTFLEKDLMQRLSLINNHQYDLHADIFFESQENKLSTKHPSLHKLLRFLYNERQDRKNQFIKLQYHIRNYLIKMVVETGILTHEWKLEDLAKREKPFVIMDFFICFFQLNAILISEDSWINFQRQTQITKIVELPLTMNKKILQNIIQKVKHLKLYPPQDKKKNQSTNVKLSQIKSQKQVSIVEGRNSMNERQIHLN